jgi:molybdopterin/thiamine biosynthesis adenylyltransferase
MSSVQAPEPRVLVVSDPLVDRYASLKLIGWWSMERVRAATVLVAGAGALGNEVIKNLTLMGVGQILIVDMDTVEAANLTRSVLFRAEDADRPKAEVAAEAAHRLNPDVHTRAISGDLTRVLGLGLFRRVSAVIGCLDNREARLFVNRSCWRVGRPWVDGAIGDLLGEARVFWPGKGACYECTLTEMDYELLNQRNSCTALARDFTQEGKLPTTPTMASIVAGLETQEALKMIHGLSVTPGSALIINGFTYDAYRLQYSEREDCLSHERYEPIQEYPDLRADTTTLRAVLAEVKAMIGPKGVLELNYDLLVAFRCLSCGTREEVLRPISETRESRLACPRCGQPRHIEQTHLLHGDEPYLDRTLADIGVPPLDILTGRTENRFVYMELSGDAQTHFNLS